MIQYHGRFGQWTFIFKLSRHKTKPDIMKHLQCRTLGALAVSGPALARMRRAFPIYRLVLFLNNTHRSQEVCIQQVATLLVTSQLSYQNYSWIYSLL